MKSEQRASFAQRPTSGFLLSALRSRLGSGDAVACTAVLFALQHLSLSQFGPMSVLGLACGAAMVFTDSVAIAVACHMGHNMAALVWGALLADGLVSSPAPPLAVTVFALAGLLGCNAFISKLKNQNTKEE